MSENAENLKKTQTHKSWISTSVQTKQDSASDSFCTTNDAPHWDKNQHKTLIFDNMVAAAKMAA